MTDVWERAFIPDYKPAERPVYIGAFFSDIDRAACEQRPRKGAAARSGGA